MGREVKPLSIREGDPHDIPALMSISAEGFPESPRWRKAGRFARRWWRVALGSPFAETWVVEGETGLMGFVVLVVDEAGWSTERRRRCGSPMDYLLAMAAQPGMILNELRRRRRLRADVARPPHVPPEEAMPWGERTWIELIAVSSRARRMGVARQLQDWCEARTPALGRDRIELNVEPENGRMRAWCEGIGYVFRGHTHAGCLYSRRIAAR
jgi:ribosomal protein S18 acetylase RimI-like enzyme